MASQREEERREQAVVVADTSVGIAGVGLVECLATAW